MGADKPKSAKRASAAPASNGSAAAAAAAHAGVAAHPASARKAQQHDSTADDAEFVVVSESASAAAKKRRKSKKPAAADADAEAEALLEGDDIAAEMQAATAARNHTGAGVAVKRAQPSHADDSAPFQRAVYTKSKTPSTYDPSLYPKAKPGGNPHPHVPMFTALSTYFAYGLLIFVGHCRDFLNRWGLFRTAKSTPTGGAGKGDMAPLVSDFDDFYTRRLYHRIESAWNRPIASCPASVMTLLTRARPAYGDYYKLTGQTQPVLNLGSYNYLGFGDPNSPTKAAVFEALEQYGVSTTSSRVALGTTVLHAELEKLVAHFTGKPAAMIFGMGFGTNSTGIPALVGKGGLIISDANNHSSIAWGARTSGAVIRVFKHNDMKSLEAVLRHALVNGQPKTHRPWRKILILAEGIYSMEGEMCPLRELVALKKKYKAYLFVDEAHSIGAIGDNGRGICEHQGVDPADVDILMGTFTKSFGAVGGYIAADKNTIDFLRSNCAGAVYHAGISPPAVQQVLSAFKIMLHEDGTSIGRRKLDSLRSNANYFRQRLIDMGCHVLGDWDSPIVMLMLYHPTKIISFSEECLKRGLAVVVVGFPATPLLLARVRICISAGHTRAQLDYALMMIEDVADLMGMKYQIAQL